MSSTANANAVLQHATPFLNSETGELGELRELGNLGGRAKVLLGQAIGVAAACSAVARLVARRPSSIATVDPAAPSATAARAQRKPDRSRPSAASSDTGPGPLSVSAVNATIITALYSQPPLEFHGPFFQWTLRTAVILVPIGEVTSALCPCFPVVAGCRGSFVPRCVASKIGVSYRNSVLGCSKIMVCRRALVRCMWPRS